MFIRRLPHASALFVVLAMLSSGLSYPQTNITGQDSNVNLSYSNSLPQVPVAVKNRPGMEYDHLPVDGFNSVRAKFPSAMMNIKSYGTPGQLTSVAMDGGPAEQTGVSVDGISIANGQNDVPDVSILPLELAESADIYKDNLLPYGLNAPAGMVNFNLPGTRRDISEVSVYGGDYSRYGGKMVFARSYNDMGYSIGGSYSSAGNNFNYTNFLGVTNQAQNMDYTKYSLMGKFRYSDWDASLSFTSKDCGTGFYYDTTGREKDDVLLSALDWHDNDARLGLSYFYWHDNYSDPSIPELTDDTNQTISLTAQNIYKFGFYTLQPSIDSRVLLFSGTGMGNVSDDQTSAVIENIFRINPIEMDLSINQIYSTIMGYAPAAGFSASWKVLDSFKISGSISEVNHFPSFNDLYWPNDGFEKGNPGLLPETGYSWKTGVIYSTMPFTAGLFYNESRLRDLILWAPVNAVWMPENVGQTLSRGLGLTSDYEAYFGEFYVRADFSYSINSTINNDPSSPYFGKYIIYTPFYKTALGLEGSCLKTWGGGLSFRQASERFTTEDNNDWLPPYYVLDARIFWQFIYLSIENIFDYQYEEIAGYPQMGRSVTLGLDFKF